MSDTFRLVLAQLNPVVGAIAANTARAREAWEKGRAAGADMVALTEMFASSVHHLPVVDGGRVVGIVTDTDLMGLGRHTPFALKSAITRSRAAVRV